MKTMTKKDRDLLLKDLCARLPYGVKVENTSFSEPQIHTLFGRVSDDEFLMLETYKSIGGEDYRRVTDDVHYTGYLESIKPYLRSMSSMTEEEKKYISEKCGFSIAGPIRNECELIMPVLAADWLIDFYNECHFDYRGLIPMGLALEAPEDMYKTE